MCIVCAVGHVACLFCVCENRQFILCVNYSTAQFHSHSRLFTSLYESKCLMSVSIQALNWFRNICHILTWLRSIKKGSYICTIVHWIAASPEILKQTFTFSHHTRSVWDYMEIFALMRIKNFAQSASGHRFIFKIPEYSRFYMENACCNTVHCVCKWSLFSIVILAFEFSFVCHRNQHDFDTIQFTYAQNGKRIVQRNR